MLSIILAISNMLHLLLRCHSVERNYSYGIQLAMKKIQNNELEFEFRSVWLSCKILTAKWASYTWGLWGCLSRILN